MTKTFCADLITMLSGDDCEITKHETLDFSTIKEMAHWVKQIKPNQFIARKYILEKVKFSHLDEMELNLYQKL